MRFAHTLATLGVLAVLAGCTPATQTTPPATPQPAPSMGYYCTPDGETSGAPCTQEEYEAQLERDKLYTEAESVYTTLSDAEQLLFRSGAPADESVLHHVTGEAREAVIESHSSPSLRLVEGEARIVWIKRNPHEAKAGSVVALTSCIDNTNATTQRVPNGPRTKGGFALEYSFFTHIDGRLQVVLFEHELVESC